MIIRKDEAEYKAKLLNFFDINDLIMSAVAYYLGRMTVQTGNFCTCLITAWPLLHQGVQEFVRRRVEEEFEREKRLASARLGREQRGETVAYMPSHIGLFGQECDRQSWVRVRSLWHKGNDDANDIRFSDKDGVNNHAAVREFLGNKIVECALCNNTGVKSDGHGGDEICTLCKGHTIRFLSYNGKDVIVTPCHGDIIRNLDGVMYLIDRDHSAWYPEQKETTEPVEAGPIPPPLNSAIVKNFETLRRACDNQDLALVSVLRKSNNEPASVVCAANRLSDGSACMVPIAEMLTENPFEIFHPPCPVKDIGKLQSDSTIEQN